MPANFLKPSIITLLLVASGQGFAQDEELPDDDFLEFLGEWESADGDWVDPLEFAEYELAEDLSKRCKGSKKRCRELEQESDES